MSRVRELLAESIALADTSPPGTCPRMREWIIGWAQSVSASVYTQEVWPRGENVIITVAFGPGPVIVLNSHMDVVGVDDQLWRTDPFVLTGNGETLYGRGASDAKGSLVSMMCAIEQMIDEPQGFNGSIVLTAVVGEEMGGWGSAALADLPDFSGDFAIVGEPTHLHVAAAHKGTYMRSITITGRASHSASPWAGANALTGMADLVQMCDTFDQTVLSVRHDPLLVRPSLTCTIGQSGSKQNTVPESARLVVDRRLVPGESHEECDGELSEILDAWKTHPHECAIASVEELVRTVPSHTDVKHPGVQAALEALGELAGHPVDAVGFNAGCDMSKLVALGIPTIICGPGGLESAHGPDESIDGRELDRAPQTYATIMTKVGEAWRFSK